MRAYWIEIPEISRVHLGVERDQGKLGMECATRDLVSLIKGGGSGGSGHCEEKARLLSSNKMGDEKGDSSVSKTRKAAMLIAIGTGRVSLILI